MSQKLYTVRLTRAELEAVSLALDNCNGDVEDVEALYGSGRLYRAALSVADKLRRLEHPEARPQ